MSGCQNNGAGDCLESLARYPLYGSGDAVIGSIDDELRLRDANGRFAEADRDYRRSLLAACQIVAARRQR